MPDLDYGYEVTIQQNATFDPTGTADNQWQRQVAGNASWENISGATGETYTVASGDRSAKLRLEQSLNGAKAYSNELQVTSDPLTPGDGSQEISPPSDAYMSFKGGILVPGNKIVAIPHDGEKYIVFDVDTQTSTEHLHPAGMVFGHWWGGVLAETNGCIYCAPGYGSSVLRLSPVFGSWDIPETYYVEDPSFIKEGEVYAGAVASNGTVYCIPYNSDKVLAIRAQFEPDTPSSPQDYAWTINTNIAGTRLYSGGVRANNGFIYCVPHSANKVLVINTLNNSTHDFTGNALVALNGSKWSGGVLAPNGKIYCIPYNATSVLEIDPTNETVSTFGVLDESKPQWDGGVLAPNGKIYGIPLNAKKLLEIDPVARTVETYDLPAKGFNGGTLAEDGNIYCMPWSNPKIFKIATGQSPGPTWEVPGLPGNTLDPMATYFNKF